MAKKVASFRIDERDGEWIVSCHIPPSLSDVSMRKDGIYYAADQEDAVRILIENIKWATKNGYKITMDIRTNEMLSNSSPTAFHDLKLGKIFVNSFESGVLFKDFHI